MASQPGTFNIQELADAGAPLVGGRLYTYDYGTTTQKTAYTDAAGTVAHTYTADGLGGQYIALNSRGELPAPLYLAGGSYDLALKRADGSSVWTRRADAQAPSVAPADLSSTSNFALGVTLVGGASRVIDSIAVLRTLPKTGSQRVIVAGYYAAGDGGGGLYYYDASDTASADNGGTIIVAVDGGRWKLVLTAPVTVLQFGAKGDGVTNDYAAFQAACTWAGSVNAGIVHVPVRVYYTAGSVSLTVPSRVCLKGMAEGPFDMLPAWGSPPWAPTILVTNTATQFIYMTGYGAKVMNLMFAYPNQVAPTAATPTAYPPTITMYGGEAYAAQAVTGVTILNGYVGISVDGALRSRIENCILGCYSQDIVMEDVVDWFILHNIMFQVMWHNYAGTTYPQAIDAWVLNNGYALTTLRVDSLIASNLGVFSRYCFHTAVDSARAITPKCGYGRFSNIDIDTVAYGVIAVSANTPGFHYTNIDFGANGGVGTHGQSAALTQAGGSIAPVLTFSNGSIRGAWAVGGNFPFSFSAAGQIYTTDIRGMQPAGSAVVTPAFPATTVGVANPYPFPVLVSASGAFSTITVAGVNIEPINGHFVLPPGKTVAFAYTGTPGWAWVGI